MCLYRIADGIEDQPAWETNEGESIVHCALESAMQCATSLVMWLAAHPMGCVEERRERKSECALRVIFLHTCWTGERGDEDCEGCFPVSRRKLCHTSMHTHTRGMDAMSRGQGRGNLRDRGRRHHRHRQRQVLGSPVRQRHHVLRHHRLLRHRGQGVSASLVVLAPPGHRLRLVGDGLCLLHHPRHLQRSLQLLTMLQVSQPSN